MRPYGCGALICVACSGSAAPVAPPNAGQKPTTPMVVTPATTSAPTYDVDALGVPRIASASYIDLAPVMRLSMFRSALGHDYHDAFESCRSMKHYFQPVSTVDWSTIRISSPVDGMIVYLRTEQTFGTQVAVRATTQPAFTFIIFHVAHRQRRPCHGRPAHRLAHRHADDVGHRRRREHSGATSS